MTHYLPSLSPTKLLKYLECTLTLLENWTETEKYKQLEPKEEFGYIMSKNTSQTIPINIPIRFMIGYQSVTAEFQHMVKAMTLKDRRSLCKKNIRPTQLSRILVQESTSKEKVLKPFWTSHLKEKSKNLWLPTKIGSQDLHLNSLNTSYPLPQMLKSWFSTNLVLPRKKELSKTFYKSLTSTVQKSTDPENIKTRTRKIKIHPNQDQRKILKQFLGTYRFFYNKGLSYINNLEHEHCMVPNVNGKYLQIHPDLLEPNSKNKILTVEGSNYIRVEKLGTHSLKSRMKPQYVCNNDGTHQLDDKGKEIRISQCSFYTMRNLTRKDLPTWFEKKLPERIMTQSMKELANAYKACLSKKGKFIMKFKRKKEKLQTINLEKCSFSKGNSFFSKWLGKHINSTENFGKLKKGDSSLTYNRKTREWFLNINLEEKYSTIRHPFSAVAIDPGVRDFLTLFSPENHVLGLGVGVATHLLGECKIMDKLESKISKTNNRSGLIRALHRKINKIKNLRNELHNKCVNTLCKLYKKIYYPDFKPSSMVSKLNHKTSRNMYNLGFYTFKEKLKSKCETNNCELVICTEEYTSKTCSNCGNIYEIGSSKIYSCSKCKCVFDRDINAAKNIYLKNDFS